MAFCLPSPFPDLTGLATVSSAATLPPPSPDRPGVGPASPPPTLRSHYIRLTGARSKGVESIVS